MEKQNARPTKTPAEVAAGLTVEEKDLMLDVPRRGLLARDLTTDEKRVATRLQSKGAGYYDYPRVGPGVTPKQSRMRHFYAYPDVLRYITE